MTTTTRRALVSVRQAARRWLHATGSLRPQDMAEIPWTARAWLYAARGPVTLVERALSRVTEPTPTAKGQAYRITNAEGPGGYGIIHNCESTEPTP